MLNEVIHDPLAWRAELRRRRQDDAALDALATELRALGDGPVVAARLSVVLRLLGSADDALALLEGREHPLCVAQHALNRLAVGDARIREAAGEVLAALYRHPAPPPGGAALDFEALARHLTARAQAESVLGDRAAAAIHYTTAAAYARVYGDEGFARKAEAERELVLPRRAGGAEAIDAVMAAARAQGDTETYNATAEQALWLHVATDRPDWVDRMVAELPREHPTARYWGAVAELRRSGQWPERAEGLDLEASVVVRAGLRAQRAMRLRERLRWDEAREVAEELSPEIPASLSTPGHVWTYLVSLAHASGVLRDFAFAFDCIDEGHRTLRGVPGASLFAVHHLTALELACWEGDAARMEALTERAAVELRGVDDARVPDVVALCRKHAPHALAAVNARLRSRHVAAALSTDRNLIAVSRRGVTAHLRDQTLPSERTVRAHRQTMGPVDGGRAALFVDLTAPRR